MLKKLLNKNSLNSRKKGQAMLIVMVISTLTLIILLGTADRIINTRTNQKRSYEFDRAFSAGENALAELMKTFSLDKSCLPSSSSEDYIEIPSSCYQEKDAKILAKVKEQAPAPVTIKKPITLFVSEAGDTTRPYTSTTIRTQCSRADATRYIVTRIYELPDGDLAADKIISDCSSAQNLTLRDSSGNNVSSRNNTRLVRVRLLETPGIASYDNNILVNVQSPTGSLASTGAYDFLVIGKGGLGSDNMIKFELPREDYDAPLGFDFVYFGDDF